MDDPAKEEVKKIPYYYILTVAIQDGQKTSTGEISFDEGTLEHTMLVQCMLKSGNTKWLPILYWHITPQPRDEEYAFVLTCKIDDVEVTVRDTMMLPPGTTRHQALADTLTRFELKDDTTILYWSLEKNKL
jgi:hypothetical protein